MTIAFYNRLTINRTPKANLQQVANSKSTCRSATNHQNIVTREERCTAACCTTKPQPMQCKWWNKLKAFVIVGFLNKLECRGVVTEVRSLQLPPLILGWVRKLSRKLFVRIRKFGGAKNAIWKNIKDIIKILSNHDLFCQTFTTVCRKIASFCPGNFFYPRRRCLNVLKMLKGAYDNNKPRPV